MQFNKIDNSLRHSLEKAASQVGSFPVKCVLLLLAVCAIAAFLVSCAKISDVAKIIFSSEASAEAPLTVSEERFAQMFEYEYCDEGIVITKYLGDDSVLDIPAYAGTMPITAIGQDAFDGCDFLAIVTIPDGVTEIGLQSFRGCSSLSSVTLPDSLKKIGDRAFVSSYRLDSIDIPANVETIGVRAFANVESFRVSGKNSHFRSEGGVLFSKDMTLLHSYPSGSKETSYTIPKTVTRIGDAAFEGSESLTAVSMHNGVTEIGAVAFAGCTSLSSIELSKNIVSIGVSAFRDCKALPSFTISDSVKSIGSGAFTGIDKILISENNSHYCILEGVLFSNDMTLLHTYPCGKKDTYYAIPGSVTRIGGCAFEDNASLTDVAFPTSVVFIEDYAFRDCTAISTMTIPTSVTSIGNWAFFNCDALTHIMIPSSVNDIGLLPFCLCRDDLVILCQYGSYAETYAIDNGIAFETF